MDALGAARTGDPIGHGVGLFGMLIGAAAGAVISLAVGAGTVATGGLLAGVIIAGSVAGGALATQQILKSMTKKVFNLPDPPTGILHHGSHEVMINSLPAARATGDGSYACTGGSGFYWNHPALPLGGILPSGILLAEGSKTVLFNNLPAARVGSLLTCAAKVLSGSRNVFIGGPTQRTEFVWDTTGWLETGFTFLGLAALGGAARIAVKAGVVATGVFALMTGGAFAGLEGVGQLGDMLGPGYRDLFQGILGMGLLLAGPKLARNKPVKTLQQTVTQHKQADLSPKKPVLSPEEAGIYQEVITQSAGREHKEIVIFGHGEWEKAFGTFIVPEGTEITVYSKHGGRLTLELAELIAKGQLPKGVYKRTYKAGERMPNYELSPAPKLRIAGLPIRTTYPKLLSNLLKPGMGKCHWCACTYVKNTKMGEFQFGSDGVTHAPFPPEGKEIPIPEGFFTGFKIFSSEKPGVKADEI